MDPGLVSTETRRACFGIAVTGALMVMAGVLLGFAAEVMGLPQGWPEAGVVAWGLVVGGMFCGVLLIIGSKPVARAGAANRPRQTPRPPGRTGPPARTGPLARTGPPARTRAPAGTGPPGPPGSFGPPELAAPAGPPPPAADPGPPGPAGPSEEWLRALRPDAPPPPPQG